MSNMDEGVVVAEHKGQVLYYNPAARELLGFKEEEPLTDMKGIGAIKLQKELLRAALDAGEHDAASRPSGNFVRFGSEIGTGNDRRYLEFYTGIVDAGEGKERLRLLLIMDRTEKKRLEAVLSRSNGEGLVTKDPRMLELIGRIEQIAQSSAFVLLQGESGTGKTQLGRMLHTLSQRARQPFIEVNCAAIPDTLIESELFGHVKGAFTGATQGRPGRFQSAHKGTLFLDEVSEIPINLQAKLLRAIQDQEFEPVGSDKSVQVDVRVISASNRNLRELVEDGGFRADLYYRLAVIPLTVPPLRERPGDIPLLCDHFLRQLRRRGYPEEVQIGRDALRVMMDYPWPGNVRELENAVEHGVICGLDHLITADSLPQDIRLHAAEVAPPLTSTDGIDERDRIIDAMRRATGSRAVAAGLLGIDRSTLWRRMRKYGLS
ncbi:MAG: sigma 54-interacting transcriptional regulator [Gammaproteobacteria bacterium]|nr:sigma 54-interacting transcriptional regulator [Gammaproteobacteria bacterium]MBU1653526.1 sigma 54-interacting transcriptional regulator [Gammaproteobacteria bacterium]MBU1962555.1 sigma 54-interacting transcriptional regulator [Gammaproteobacteria bacterium]